MKKILTIIFSVAISVTAFAQDFNKHVASAKSAYAAGKLEDSRFAMQQALQELDIALSKEVLKILPTKLETLNYNASADNVTGSSGFVGMFIHRDYGTDAKKASLEVISNSPLMASINAILSLPFAGTATGQKVVKISGYKALIQKETDSETNKNTFNLQLPLNSSLVTLKLENGTEDEVVKYANALPVTQLAKMIQ